MTTDAAGERGEHDSPGLPSRDYRPDAVVDAIHTNAAQVKQRQLTQALRSLEASGEVTAAQRAAVATLADRLVDRLLAPPTASLRAAAADSERADIAVALRLFDAEADVEVADE